MGFKSLCSYQFSGGRINKCLICDRECKNARALGRHVKLHNLTIRQYKERFNLIRKCINCGKELSKKCRGNFCNKCRDRTGSLNPFYGKRHKEEIIDIIKFKLAEASRKNWTNPDYRDKVIKAMSKPRHDNFKLEQSARLIKWYNDNPEQRHIRSVAMKNSWLNGNIVRTKHSCNRSKIEKKFFADIQDLSSDVLSTPTVWLENGKYLFPDILIEDIGLIIEFYGDYWHANPLNYNSSDIVHHDTTAKDIWIRDKERIQKFNRVVGNDGNCFGYNVEIVWEHEYRHHKEEVLNRLDVLINWISCAF